jgi:hypothetical protein
MLAGNLEADPGKGVGRTASIAGKARQRSSLAPLLAIIQLPELAQQREARLVRGSPFHTPVERRPRAEARGRNKIATETPDRRSVGQFLPPGRYLAVSIEQAVVTQDNRKFGGDIFGAEGPGGARAHSQEPRDHLRYARAPVSRYHNWHPKGRRKSIDHAWN